MNPRLNLLSSLRPNSLGLILAAAMVTFGSVALKAEVFQGTSSADTIQGGTASDTFFLGDDADVGSGGDGRDFIFGEGGADALYGDAGNDVILGGSPSVIGDSSDNQFTGGAGDDLLWGGTGSDSYYYNLGDGLDVIREPGSGAGSVDKVFFGPGITPESLGFSREKGDLFVEITGADILKIESWFGSATGDFRIEEFHFDSASTLLGSSLPFDGVTWNGTAGADTYTAPTSGNYWLLGAAGNDALTGAAGMDVILGEIGNDNLSGRDGDDALYGGVGDDSLNGENGNDSLNGGDGNDSLSGLNGLDELRGGTGNDTLYGGYNNDVYYWNLGDGDDVILDDYASTTGRDDINRLVLGAGISPSDVMWEAVSGYSSRLKFVIRQSGVQVGSLCVDEWSYNYASKRHSKTWRIEFADGTIWYGANLVTPFADTITGTASIDELHGGGGDDFLYGLDGNDSLYGENGIDVLYGGNGDDTLDGGAGIDTLQGEEGNDVLYGGADNDTLTGGNGNDSLNGGDGNDTLNGSNGLDELRGGTGNDALNGGYNNDTYYWNLGDGDDVILDDYDSTTGRNDINRLVLGAGISPSDVTWEAYSSRLKFVIRQSGVQVGSVSVDQWSSGPSSQRHSKTWRIEFADGTIWYGANLVTPFADTITGTASFDEFNGGGGDDFLYGLDGADSLYGENGNDFLYGGNGNDTLDGGAGIDLLQGEEGDDSLNGGADNDTLTGGNGNDSLNGGDGNDTLYGGSGNDSLNGGAGNDILYGDDGDDLIEGGSGNDTLYGGNGSNRYVYHLGEGYDVIYANPSQSTIKDSLDLKSILRSYCGIQTLAQSSGLRITLTFLNTQETLTIYNGEKVVIEFADAVVEFDAQGNDVRAANTAILSWWRDSDGDGYPDDVEQALQAYASSSANPSNAAVVPAIDAIADGNLLTPLGNRYPTIQAALNAAEKGRNGKPYVVIKVEPGVYNEDLIVLQSGVMLKGGGGAGRTIIKKGNAGKHSIVGSRLIFDQLCFGDFTEAQSMTLQSGTGLDCLRFSSCLFRESNLGLVQGMSGGSIAVKQGDAAFVHCTWIGAKGVTIADTAKIKLVNSLVDATSSSTWAQSSKVVKFSSIVTPFSTGANSSVPSVRRDGLIKVLYPGKLSVALNSVIASDRIQGNKDLDGEVRDSSPDIGCDEYVDSDDNGAGDALADSWETLYFANLTSDTSTGDPDTDGRSNLEEYLAETNPLDVSSAGEAVVVPDLSATSVYQTSNLFGPNPLPTSSSADWLFDNVGKIQLMGRQGALEFEVYLEEAKIAALSLDATFKHLTSSATVPGAARIYLDDELACYLTGPLTNVVVPLYFVKAGSHRIRVEFLNSQRDYSPILNSIAFRELASEYLSEGLIQNVILSTNRITSLRSASLVSPAFVEGKSLHPGGGSIDLPAESEEVEIHQAPNQGWFANVPLEESSSGTSVVISVESGRRTESVTIQWLPTILENVPALKIRKGDSLRLQALATGVAPNTPVTYKINGQTAGIASSGSALTHLFDVAGSFTVVAEVNGVVIPGAVTTVTVASADFGPVFNAALSTSMSWQVNMGNGLFLEADDNLGVVSQNGNILGFTPQRVGNHLMVARLEREGPIIATGNVNVFSVTTTGFNGGGRMISTLPDGRKLIDMSYSVDGPIPANLLIKVEVWISGTTFVDGSTIAWLRPEDFDQFGVAHLQVIATDGSHGICQLVKLYLEDEE